MDFLVRRSRRQTKDSGDRRTPILGCDGALVLDYRFPAISDVCYEAYKPMHPRVLIVVKSLHHQNTAKVAHAIAEVLQADVCSPEDIPASKAGQYDLLGIGSGVYFGAFHRDLRTWLRTLDSCTLSRSAFIFSTSGLSCLYPVWHARSRRQLVSKGYRVIGDFSCRGWDTVGPLLFIGGLNRRHPDAYDLKRAADFARSMLTAWQLPGSAQAPIR